MDKNEILKNLDEVRIALEAVKTKLKYVLDREIWDEKVMAESDASVRILQAINLHINELHKIQASIIFDDSEKERIRQLIGLEKGIFLLTYDRVGGEDSGTIKKQVLDFIGACEGIVIEDKYPESAIVFESTLGLNYWKSMASKSKYLEHITVVLVQSFSDKVEDIYFKKGKPAPEQ